MDLRSSADGLVQTVGGVGDGDYARHYDQLLARIGAVAQDFSVEREPRNILRVGLQALASPLWPGTTTQLLRFLIQLKGKDDDWLLHGYH